MRRLALALGLLAGAARADLPPLETADLGDVGVSIWTYNFPDADEADLLRMLMNTPSALQGWMPISGHGALAVAPEEGLWRAEGRVGSAVAVGGMGSAETAAAAARAACDALRRTGQGCIVVLQVAPK
jgi:hypothetical protein